MQVWRSIGSFKNQSSIDTWCYRIALNTAISWRRSRNHRAKHVPTGEAGCDQVAGSDDGRDGTETLRKFLEFLSDADRALILMYLEDMRGEEIAEVLGINRAAVRVRIHRIKRELADWKMGDA